MIKDKIRMRLNSECLSKLAFVKLLKEHTGLGLKEAKFTADEMFDNFSSGNSKWTDVSIIISSKLKLDELKSSLYEIGANCDIIGDVQWERNYKMLELGVGDDDDYRDFIREYTISSKDYLELILSKVPSSSLKEIFEVISKDIKLNHDSNC